MHTPVQLLISYFQFAFSRVSSLLGAVNFITTVLICAYRIYDFSVCLYLLVCYYYSVFIVIVFAVLAGAITMLLTDRNFNTCFLTLQVAVILFVSTFILVLWPPWSYILILPGFGIISQIVCLFLVNMFLVIWVWFTLCINRYIRFCSLSHHMYTVG